MRTFRVAISLPDGRTDEVTVTALDEWKARSASMLKTTLRGINGQLVSYRVTERKPARVEDVVIDGKVFTRSYVDAVCPRCKRAYKLGENEYVANGCTDLLSLCDGCEDSFHGGE